MILSATLSLRMCSWPGVLFNPNEERIRQGRMLLQLFQGMDVARVRTLCHRVCAKRWQGYGTNSMSKSTPSVRSVPQIR